MVPDHAGSAGSLMMTVMFPDDEELGGFVPGEEER
jgi:hypothetical protein